MVHMLAKRQLAKNAYAASYLIPMRERHGEQYKASVMESNVTPTQTEIETTTRVSNTDRDRDTKSGLALYLLSGLIAQHFSSSNRKDPCH